MSEPGSNEETKLTEVKAKIFEGYVDENETDTSLEGSIPT